MSPTVSLYRRKAKNSKKLANAFMYSSVLVLIASIASISYRPPVDTAYSASDVDNFGATASAEVSKPSVDQLAVANLAASTAAVAGLSVADEVANMSISLNAKSELAQADETVITKPQVFEPTISKAFSTYATVVGDTTTSLAAAYGITAETLRWANNLTSDALTPGTSLIIPTVDGVVYTTKDGDTIAAVAAKYKADEARIISKNDLELTGLVAGQKILLPAGTLPENERPGYVAPRSTRITRSVPGATGQVSLGYAVQAGNRYGYGYCTWYVYNRRVEIGRPIGSFWGNASSWAYAARASGYLVNHTPAVGAVMQNGGGAGHVAVVEELRDDGSIRVSEMNYYGGGGGWNRVSSRTLDAGAAAAYTFIH